MNRLNRTRIKPAFTMEPGRRNAPFCQVLRINVCFDMFRPCFRACLNSSTDVSNAADVVKPNAGCAVFPTPGRRDRSSSAEMVWMRNSMKLVTLTQGSWMNLQAPVPMTQTFVEYPSEYRRVLFARSWFGLALSCIPTVSKDTRLRLPNCIPRTRHETSCVYSKKAFRSISLTSRKLELPKTSMTHIVETSATLVVTSALLVVTRSY